MNDKINLDIKSLKFILEKNKPFIFPCLIIIVCIVLFFQFIVPQLKSLLVVQEQAKGASLRLKTLKENLNILTNTDEDHLDSQLQVLNQALPFSKDFSGILSSIYFASQKTGVALGAFSLKIGDLSDSQKDSKFPIITMSIPINSGVVGASSFVDVIGKTVPLSEVTLVKIGDRVSTVALAFYYKPLGLSNKEDFRVKPISQQGLLLIGRLKSFENVSSAETPNPL